MISLGRGRDGRFALLRDGVSPTHAAIVLDADEWRELETSLRTHNTKAVGDTVFKANELGGWKAWNGRARSGDVVDLSTNEAHALADAIRELAAFGRDGGERPDATRGDDADLIDEDPEADDPIDALRVLLVEELHATAAEIEGYDPASARFDPVIAALHRMADRIAKARFS